MLVWYPPLKRERQDRAPSAWLPKIEEATRNGRAELDGRPASSRRAIHRLIGSGARAAGVADQRVQARYSNRAPAVVAGGQVDEPEIVGALSACDNWDQVMSPKGGKWPGWR